MKLILDVVHPGMHGPGLFGVGCWKRYLPRRGKSDVLGYAAFDGICVLRNRV